MGSSPSKWHLHDLVAVFHLYSVDYSHRQYFIAHDFLIMFFCISYEPFMGHYGMDRNIYGTTLVFITLNLKF